MCIASDRTDGPAATTAASLRCDQRKRDFLEDPISYDARSAAWADRLGAGRRSARAAAVATPPVTVHRQSFPAPPPLLRPARTVRSLYAAPRRARPLAPAFARRPSPRSCPICASTPAGRFGSIAASRARSAIPMRPRRSRRYRRTACHGRPDPPRRRPLSRSLQPDCVDRARSGVAASVLMAIFGHETSYGAVTGSFDIARCARHAGLRRAPPSFVRRGIRRRDEVARSRHLARPAEGQLGRRHRLSAIHAFGRAATCAPMVSGDGRRRHLAQRAGRLRLDRQLPSRCRLEGQHAVGNPGARRPTDSIAPRCAISPTSRRLPAGLCPPQPPDDHARMAGDRASPRSAARFAKPSSLNLFEPDGPGGTAYLLTEQLQAILKYNCSNFYAFRSACWRIGIIGR